MPILLKSEVLAKLKELKPIYEKDGIYLEGIFGSYARDEAKDSSDIDLLFELDEKVFLAKYPAFRAFSKLTQIKEELQAIFDKKVDLADKATLRDETKQHILKDLIYAN